MKKVRFKKTIPRPLSREGYCNICGKFRKLTYDHIPPKGCVGINTQQAALLINFLKIGELDKRNARLLQNGLNFKSICSDCNNRLLGAYYDPALKDFAKQVSSISDVKKRLTLPPKVTIKIKPLPVMKAVAGHLLAARIRKNMNEPLKDAPAINALQKFVLDRDALPSNYLKFYYWFYPSDIQVIILGCGLINNLLSSERNFVIADIIKFYPLGFMVTFDSQENIPEQFRLMQITVHDNVGLDTESEILLKLENLPKIDWPEHQEDNSVMLLNDEFAYISKKY